MGNKHNFSRTTGQRDATKMKTSKPLILRSGMRLGGSENVIQPQMNDSINTFKLFGAVYLLFIENIDMRI